MSAWRRKALELLPRYRSVIDSAENPMGLWLDLGSVFEGVVKSGDKNTTRRILDYAVWCVSDKSGKLPNNTSTAAYCAFYEHLGKNESFWPYFKDWFFIDEYERLRSTFAYFLDEVKVARMDSVFYGKD